MDINVTHLHLPSFTPLHQNGSNYTVGDFLLIGAGKTDTVKKGQKDKQRQTYTLTDSRIVSEAAKHIDKWTDKWAQVNGETFEQKQADR